LPTLKPRVYRVDPALWEQYEAYLHSVMDTLKPSACAVYQALKKQFPHIPSTVRMSEEMKQFIQSMKGADVIHVADKLQDTNIRKEQSQTTATIEGKRVKSLDDLLALAEVDLEVWEVERFVSNKWEMGARTEAGVEVTPLYQIKAWLKRKKVEAFDYLKVREADLAYLKQYAPVYHSLKREKVTDGHLLLLDPADNHFGKYAVAEETGEPYNLSIAEKRIREGVTGVLTKSNGYPLDRIALLIGNDLLHTDDGKNTTKGTPQDTDGLFHEAYQLAKRTMIEVIEGLLLVSDVHLVFNPSNHDYRSGYMLFDAIACHFHKAKNLTCDGSIAYYKYMMYGNSLIGSTHGDGAKPTDLANIIAHEAKSRWADAVYTYFYTHHVHHKSDLKYATVKDYIGVTVESVRSGSAADSWHAKKFYKGAPMAMEGFIHSKEYGQVDRITHNFRPTNPKGMPVYELTPNLSL
jgi:hypothetical protein